MALDPDSTTATTTAGVAEGDPEPVRGRIVVGVDDSEQAAAALRWALAEGVLRQATVEVVHAWSEPMAALPFARASVDEVVDAALAEMEEQPPEVLRTILPGGPALTLVEVAESADLLVVGSHGRTGLSRMVLGSVAMACVQHAPCPVVVVRTPSED
jgi:nucleotide-binding universal stress UspA family protein